MSKERPEYIKCIRHTHVDKTNTSWCGSRLYSFDWFFQDIDHAAYAIRDDDRLVPCPECLNSISRLLTQ